MSDETDTELLARLSTGSADVAWSEFLAQYTPLLMHVIRRHDAHDGHASECFAHVCDALSDDGFRRLRSFRPDGPARFRTWLMAVVSNLCADWRRKAQGRIRPPRCVSHLPELDQQVHRCMYLRGMSRAQCVEALVPQFPELTEAKVSAINAGLFALLTPQQRWQSSVRTPASLVGAGSTGPEDDDSAYQVASPDPGPDELTARWQQQRQLRVALSKLPADQRLLLRLRYEQNLSLAEVARVTGQPDPFRANRRIQAALEALADLMGSGMQ